MSLQLSKIIYFEDNNTPHLGNVPFTEVVVVVKWVGEKSEKGKGWEESSHSNLFTQHS